jgi:hypothetical protein
MRKIIVGFILIQISTGFLYAQKEIINQELSWYGYFNTLIFSEKWQLTSEIQERHFISPTRQHQFLLRSQATRKLGSGWSGSFGFCYFLQSPNDPLAQSRLLIPELRPHLELSQKQVLKYVTLDHRYRFEARFFHNTNDERTELEDGYDLGNFRFRYRLTASVPIWKFAEKQSLKFKVSDELHVNIGSKIKTNVFEQNRLYAGLNVDATKDLALEFGYLNWFQQRNNGTFYNRHIARFTIYHKIDLSKRKKQAPVQSADMI